MKFFNKIVNFQQNFHQLQGIQHILSYRAFWLGIIGVLMLLFGGVFEGKSQLPDAKENAIVDRGAEQDLNKAQSEFTESALEAKLIRILSQVKGAGKVAVNITFIGSEQQVYAKNKTGETKTVQEKDTAGGTRTTTEKKDNEQILVNKGAGSDRPVVIGRIYPEVKGVIVVAQGAVNSAVKSDLTKAVETGLGIASYKITVLPQ